MSNTTISPNPKMIASVIDHTFLKTEKEGVVPAEQMRQVEILVDQAHRLGAFSVCVRESQVKCARKKLDALKSAVRVVSVVGFPEGDLYSTENKLSLLKQARQDGADEFDMVIRYRDLKRGDATAVYQDILQVSQEAGDQVLKVIFENCYLSASEKEQAYRLCLDAFLESCGGGLKNLKRRFFKTSTGFATLPGGAPVGATLDDVKRMTEIGKGLVGIKPAGGVNTSEQAVEFWKAAGSAMTSDGKNIDPLRFRIGSSSLLLNLDGRSQSSGGY